MSADDVLTESEIDALMESVEDDTVRSDVYDDGQYRRFDFSAKEHALLREFTLLQSLCDRHAELLEDAIERAFALEFDVQPHPVTLLSAREQTAALEMACAFTQAEIEPLSNSGLCISPGSLLSFILNAYFGGDLSIPLPSHGMTPRPSELQIASRLAETVFRSLESAWQDRLSVQALNLETLGEAVWLNARLPDQQLLCLSFDLQLIDFTSTLILLLPFEPLTPYQKRFAPPKSSYESSKASQWGPKLQTELPGIELEIAMVLDERPIALEQLLTLTAGAVLPIGSPDRVILRADNVDLATGAYGTLNANKAVQLNQIGTQESSQ